MRYLTEKETDIASRLLYLDIAIEILQNTEQPELEYVVKLGIEERREFSIEKLRLYICILTITSYVLCFTSG